MNAPRWILATLALALAVVGTSILFTGMGRAKPNQAIADADRTEDLRKTVDKLSKDNTELAGHIRKLIKTTDELQTQHDNLKNKHENLKKGKIARLLSMSQIEMGTWGVDQNSKEFKGKQKDSQHSVTFETAFEDTPMVFLSFTRFDLDGPADGKAPVRAHAHVLNLSKTGFTIEVGAHSDSQYREIGVVWLAIAKRKKE